MQALYIDDEEQGLAPETSHPRFVAVAREDFWYDCADDFSPFGNDTGNDTLRYLEEWLTEYGADANVADFVLNLLHEQWGLDKDYVNIVDAGTISQLHYSDSLHINDVQDQAIIAAALGQFKITGEVGDGIRELAMFAFRRQFAIAKAAGTDTNNPFREAVPQYIERMQKMHEVLQKWT